MSPLFSESPRARMTTPFCPVGDVNAATAGGAETFLSRPSPADAEADAKEEAGGLVVDGEGPGVCSSLPSFASLPSLLAPFFSSARILAESAVACGGGG